MSIQKISTERLRRMGDREGLVLQGCGGDPQEWLDGINQILTDEGILKKGTGFEDVYTFRHDGLTCLLFPFEENMELDMGKLTVWRLATHSTFGGTWLSDYVPNRLGGFAQVRETKAEPERINASKSSSGVQYPRFFLGRLLRASAAQRISSSEKFSMDTPLGTYRRSNPL